MLIMFAKTAGNKIAAYLNCTVTWTSNAAQSVGELSCFVPRSHEIFTGGYIDEDGGFYVVAEHPTLGRWVGVADMPEIDEKGATIHAMQLSYLATLRCVNRNMKLKNMTAGAIARLAFRSSLAAQGIAAIAEGSYLEAAPQITEYEFSGQTLASVLDDLSNKTGQEWYFKDDVKFCWTPPRGTIHRATVVQGRQMSRMSRRGDIAERVTSVSARDQMGREFTVVAGEARKSMWQRQIVIDVSSTDLIGLGLEAIQALNAQRASPIRYVGEIDTSLFAIKEGDWVKLLLPFYGSGGEYPAVRVVSRTWDSTKQRLSIECHAVNNKTQEKSISFGAARAEYGIYVPRTYDAAKLAVTLTQGVYNLQTRTVT